MQELEGFQQIANGIQGAIAKSDTQFQTTIEESTKIFGTTKQNLDAIVGGYTFVEFVVAPNMGQGNPPTYPLTILVDGKYPIRNLSAEIQRIEPGRDDASIYTQLQSMHALPIGGDILPGAHPVNERLGIGKYAIGIWSANGLSNEQVELRLDEHGQLQQSYEMHKNGKTIVKIKDGKLIFRRRRRFDPVSGHHLHVRVAPRTF